MYQIDSASANPTLPAAAGAGTPGYYIVEDLSAVPPVPGTLIDQDHLNMMMLELCNIVILSGGTLNKTSYRQCYDAIVSGIGGLALQKANNLSDLANVPTALTNLGLSKQSMFREWVMFDNNGTVLAQLSQRAGVVFAITVNSTTGGTGDDYTVTPSTPFPSANVAAIPVPQANAAGLAAFSDVGLYHQTVAGATVVDVSFKTFDSSSGNATSPTPLFIGFIY